MRLLALICLVALVAASCDELDQLDNIEEVNYDAEFALPLLNTTLRMQDILDDLEEGSSIRVDEDGLLHFIYEGDLLTQQGGNVLQDVADNIPPFIPLLSREMALPFATPGQLDIDQLNFRSGTLTYSAQNPHPQPVEVRLRIPQLLTNGNTPLEYQFSLPAYSGAGVPPIATNEDAPTDLSATRIVPTNDTLYIRYEARTPDGQQVDLTNFILRINQPTLSYAEGYLGQNNYEGGSDQIDIEFFQASYIDGNVQFADPTVTFLIENSFGIPVRALINDFAITTVEGERLNVTSPQIDAGIDFPYPPLNAVGETRTGAFVFDRSNSNIVELLNSNPLAIAYDIDVRTHPEGNVNEKGFLTDASAYSTRLAVDLPLAGQVDQFLLRDTTRVTLGELEELEEATFKLVVDNGIPIDAGVQVYFLDAGNTPLDSLFTDGPQQITGAMMNGDGVSTTTVTTERLLPYPPERLDAVRQAERLALTVRLSTGSNAGQNVRIFDEQEIAVRLGAIVRIQPE